MKKSVSRSERQGELCWLQFSSRAVAGKAASSSEQFASPIPAPGRQVHKPRV